ncbi:cytosine permease [Brenneria salicis]|uniref:cytosine permease n=1 Tax=Brenneria salicis TaxID=55214 RepID=UPI001F0BF63D|nr:cytosine permease [Brenneria salicis]
MGSDDLVEIFFNIGLGISAILVLIFAQWTTNSCNLISSSLGLSVVIRWISRPAIVVFMAFLGLLLAYNGMINNFTYFLSLLGVLISPIAGVYLVDYYYHDSSRLRQDISKAKMLNIPASISWLCGCVVSILSSPDFIGVFTITTISALDGVLVSMVVYIFLHKLFPQQIN